MADACVVGVYEGIEPARRAIHILDRADLPTDRVSLIVSDLEARPELNELRLGDDSAHDAAVGAGLGGLVGVLVGTAAIGIAGVGTVFFLGPLAGAVMGSMAGALLGALSGWGVHREHIDHYEQLVREGKALVVVHGNPVELAEAARILHETEPLEVQQHAASGDDSEEIDDAPRASETHA